MTERLYYTDPTLGEFSSQVVEVRAEGGRTAVLLDRTAFYPTSGGQLFDTGWLDADGVSLRVCEVAEQEKTGAVLHIIEPPAAVALPQGGVAVRGRIDLDRRRDHMQQHTGQHLLTAVFIQLFNAPTVSFHMGDESCTIDLAVEGLIEEQIREVELHANRLMWEDHPVSIRFASVEEARSLGVRKIPSGIESLRLIEIAGVDLTACGGTHVARTYEIGGILLRKAEKVRQGMRVEFVCGERAVRTATRDQATLRAAADMVSAHMWELPEQVCKLLDEARKLRKGQERLQSENAELLADRLLAQTPETGGARVVCSYFPEQDAAGIKLLGSRLTARPDVIALLGAAGSQPSLVFAQSANLAQSAEGPLDVGQLLKEILAKFGGRGGGNRSMAQGGVPAGVDLSSMLEEVAARVKASLPANEKDK